LCSAHHDGQSTTFGRTTWEEAARMATDDGSQRRLTRLLAGLGVASGIALIARPQQVVDRIAPAFPASRLWLVRVLGGRLLVQHGAALAVPDRRLEADRALDELEQLAHALVREPALFCELLVRRLAVELLRELAARAHEPANLVRDVDRESDRPALVGQRARY